MKRYINAAIVYTVLAMLSGVFYREYTKFYDFTDRTVLGVLHTHYFVLGMVFFLLLLLLEKNFLFTNMKTKRALQIYQIGLNLTALLLVVRGITQVQETTLSSGMDAAISGMAGIGHILLSVGILLLLIQVKRSIPGKGTESALPSK